MNPEDEKLAKESLEEGKKSVDLNEAPASATVRVWIDGYGAMVTMRSDKVGTVMERLAWVIGYAKDKGWKPTWKTEKEIGDTEEEPIEEAVSQTKQELPRTKVCECGKTRTYKTGIKKGRKWAAWFCENDQCAPEWVRTQK